MDEIINAYKILAGQSEGMRSLRIFRRKLEDNIKTDFRIQLSTD